MKSISRATVPWDLEVGIFVGIWDLELGISRVAPLTARPVRPAPDAARSRLAAESAGRALDPIDLDPPHAAAHALGILDRDPELRRCALR